MFGIDFLDNLVSQVGLPLVKQGVKALTGIDLDAKELTAEDKQKIMDSQIEIMKIDFQKLQLDSNERLESKRLDTQDTANSRDTTVKIQESKDASWLAKNTAYILDFTIILATIALGVMLFFVIIPEANMNIANIMFGAMLGYCATIIGWHRGSSKSSADKNQLLVGK